MTRLVSWARRAAVLAAVGLVILIAVLVLLWHQRPALADIGWASPPVAPDVGDAPVTVTWLGVSTLLFDDGETQVLIDAFFSRPSLADIVLQRPVASDAPTINRVMHEFGLQRLAAIVPVHSHFDHAMDTGAIANCSGATVLGSASTANIALGAGVPADQVVVAEPGAAYEFGAFTLRLLPAPHAPVGWRGSVPIDGNIDTPLDMPQPIDAFRMGGAWSILIEHAQGTALVQGSGGFEKYGLLAESADVVFLGVGLIDAVGRQHAELLWQHTVTATGATAVIPVHFDDYTRPFGTIEAMPRVLSDFARIADWLEAFRARWDTDTRLLLPVFGQPMTIYSLPPLET